MPLTEKTKLIQHWAGVPEDGVWGEQTANAILVAAGIVHPQAPNLPPRAPAAPDAGAVLTVRAACELVSHEAIVREWYKDSEGIGTWGIGVTNNSGHSVDRYKDNPQTIEHCLEIYVWLLRTRYIPDVLKAFAGFPLTEAQFAAALSFHYNTGAILKSDWVDLAREGRKAEARKFWTSHYLNGGDLQERRNKEAALFFDGTWTNDGTTTVYPVRKPSYSPWWGRGEKADIREAMTKALAA